MTDQDKVIAILSAIQTDQNVIILLRALLTNNIPNMTPIQLENVMIILNIPES